MTYKSEMANRKIYIDTEIDSCLLFLRESQ